MLVSIWGAAAVVACKFPVVVGTVVAGAVVGPSNIRYVLAAAADISVVAVVGSAVAASVDAIAAWGIGGSGVVVAVAASCLCLRLLCFPCRLLV